MSELAALTWEEAAERAPRTLLLVPLGSTEQHGPHLPLSTDTDVAVALCRRLAAARDGLLVAPAVAYGASGEHAGFAGTLSIGTDALAAVMVELSRSADAFAGIVVVCCHGGNAAALARAAATAGHDGRRLLTWMPRPRGDAHAGRTETSLLLALSAPAVRRHLAVAGERRPLREVQDELRRGGVRAVSANGVLGDPAGASAAEGERLLAEMSADLAAAVEAFEAQGAPVIGERRDGL